MFNTITSLLFPLITFPYASRIMLADGIGHVDFFYSIINYISLLTCIGIPMYAIKQIAIARDDIEKRNVVMLEILSLHLLLTVLGYIIVALFCLFVSDIKEDVTLFLILSSSIIFTTIGCDWFYKGIEDFKYIAIRGVIVKFIAAILLFSFVKSREDIYWYALFTVLGPLGGNIFNFFRLRKYISIKKSVISTLKPYKHFIPALHIFSLNIITSLYVQLNPIMLGFLSNDNSVGLFTSASKITNVLLGVSLALGTTMIPRMSNLIATGKREEFVALSQKSMRFMIALSLPMTLGLIVCAPDVVHLLCGENFENAILTLKILAPIILTISMSNVMGLQILYPLGKVNIVMLTTGIGAFVNLILNFVLVPIFHQDGAAISTVLAELSVTLGMLMIAGKYFNFKFFSTIYVKYIVASFFMFVVIEVPIYHNYTSIVNILIKSSLGLVSYVLILVILRESIVLDEIQKIKNKILSK